MAIEWNTVTATHVRHACDFVIARDGTRDRDTGLVVFAGERRLPAKEILREAYRMANGLSPETEVKFSSGEATLNVLRKLGFRAERLGSRRARESAP